MKDAQRLRLIAGALERGLPARGYCSALRDIAKHAEHEATLHNVRGDFGRVLNSHEITRHWRAQCSPKSIARRGRDFSNIN
jgi:hypothetical protein